MKTIKINNLILLLLALVVVTSCIQDDDFDTPEVAVAEPTFDECDQLTTISAVAGALSQEQDQGEPLDYDDDETIFTFSSGVCSEDTTQSLETFLEAYVVSSDAGGNFFEEIILQDALENPTMGIKLLIDVNPLFTRYEIGRKLYIKLDGLSVGISNGVVALGKIDGGRIGKISFAEEFDVIQRSATIGEVVPLPTTLDMLSNDMTNLFIQLEDVQFNRNEVLGDNPQTFASGELDEFDGERILESCTSSSSVIFSTSTFADFKGVNLPANRGSLNAILSKDFFGEVFNLNINTPEDINFDNSERCDPVELDCGLADTQGDMTIFDDDFEDQTPFSPISGNGWTNFIEAGSQSWEAYTATGTNASLGISARIGSFNSGDDSTIAWLITPAIDLDAQDNETLVFKTSNSFDDGSDYELLFSNDWDGVEANITTATWGILPAATLVTDDDFFGAWIDSGIVDLSCGEGTIHIAFKYVGSGDAAFDGTLEMDEISIDFSN